MTLALTQPTVQPAALRLSAMIFQYFLLIVGALPAWDESLIEDAETFCSN